MERPIRLSCKIFHIHRPSRINKLNLPSPLTRLHIIALRSIFALVAFCICFGVNAEMMREEIIEVELDWLPLLHIPESERELRCVQCGGRFTDPLFQENLPTDPEETELKITADDTEVSETYLVFSGNVMANQASREITADQIKVNRLLQSVSAIGEVKLREPGMLLVGEEITFDGSSKNAAVTNARFVLHQQHLTGAATKLTRNADGAILIERGEITFCSPEDPSWVLETDTLEIATGSGNGQAWGAKLRVAGVPILYLPWIRFPVDSRRKTGFLFPDIGSDTRGGVDISTPIYVNLAPNYDVLYSPRYIEERGLLQRATTRLLDPTAGYWEFTGAWLSNDTKYNENRPNNKARWLTDVKHSGKFGANWATSIRYSRASDPDYIKDLENNSLSAQRQTALQQMGRVAWTNDFWSLELKAEQFQSIAKDIADQYKKLPQISARFLGSKEILGLQPIFHTQLARFDSDRPLIKGDRLYTEIGFTKGIHWNSGFVNSTAKYRSIRYDLQAITTNSDTHPNIGSWTVNMDGGLYLERRLNAFGGTITQTLEPRFYYLYSGQQDQSSSPSFDSAELTFSYDQLYRDTRFSGFDRIDDANQVSLGVTTRIFDDKTGEEKLSASLGQIFYFEDRSVRLRSRDPKLFARSSPIAAQWSVNFNQNWRIRANLLFNHQNNTFDAANLQTTYRPENGILFNAGYSLRKPPSHRLEQPVTEQINISAFLPINFHWSVFGAFKYSLEGRESVEDMFGIEYDDCCWRIRALFMRYIETESGQITDFKNANLNRDTAIQFQVLLKGMGGLGGRVDRLLKDMIQGFREN